MRAAQYVPYVLPSVNITPGTTTIPLGMIPPQWNGRISHLAELHFHVAMTPTYTTAPTTVGNNNIFTACDIWNGGFALFQGGFNALRAMERMHTGKNRLPDADTDTASAAARNFARVWYAGPPNFAGAPTDFAIPCGLLTSAEVRITQPDITQISADTTVLTGTVNVTARLLLLDEVRLPPAYQVLTQSATGKDLLLQGRGLYETVALLDSSSFGAWAAGELGSITLEAGQGNLIQGVPDYVLTDMYQADWAAGDIGGFTGPVATGFDNAKIVNHGTPTAVAAAPADLQPVLWSGPEHRITKLHMAESVVHLYWSGTQSTAVAIYGRIAPQPQSVVQTKFGVAFARLDGRRRREEGSGLKTLSKRPYSGPLVEFMPWVAKLQ